MVSTKSHQGKKFHFKKDQPQIYRNYYVITIFFFFLFLERYLKILLTPHSQCSKHNAKIKIFFWPDKRKGMKNPDFFLLKVLKKFLINKYTDNIIYPISLVKCICSVKHFCDTSDALYISFLSNS